MNINQQELRTILEETKAYRQGHFQLTSGLHSEGYIQCALLLKEPKLAEWVGQALAKKLVAEKPEIVVGPAIGGIIIAYEIARGLGVPGIFAERVNGRMNLRRGFFVEKGQRALVAEDVITTGGSSQEVVELLQAAGVEVVGVASIIDRSQGKNKLTVPYKSLLDLEIKNYQPEECPLCKEGQSIDKPGSRA